MSDILPLRGPQDLELDGVDREPCADDLYCSYCRRSKLSVPKLPEGYSENEDGNLCYEGVRFPIAWIGGDTLFLGSRREDMDVKHLPAFIIWLQGKVK